VIPPVQDDQVGIAALPPSLYKYVQAKDVGKLTPAMLLNMLRFRFDPVLSAHLFCLMQFFSSRSEEGKRGSRISFDSALHQS